MLKFSRKWNLERHLYDVHEVHDDDLRKARVKQEIDMPDHLSINVEPKRNFLNKENNINEM
jgi:hypothetical protein